jgi:hypothetical protein
LSSISISDTAALDPPPPERPRSLQKPEPERPSADRGPAIRAGCAILLLLAIVAVAAFLAGQEAGREQVCESRCLHLQASLGPLQCSMSCVQHVVSSRRRPVSTWCARTRTHAHARAMHTHVRARSHAHGLESMLRTLSLPIGFAWPGILRNSLQLCLPPRWCKW